MGNCIIILSYIEKYTDEYIINEIKDADYVICADGGQSIAKRIGITPNCVIGDFDSTTDDTKLNCEYISYPIEKDLTDGEACLLHAIEMGFDNITYLGGIGGRLDHTLGALGLLIMGYKSNVNVVLQDMKNRVRLIDSSANITIKKDLYKYLSMYPVYDEFQIESINGARFPVNSIITMTKDSTLCISNEIRGDEAIIKLSSGIAYLIESND